MEISFMETSFPKRSSKEIALQEERPVSPIVSLSPRLLTFGLVSLLPSNSLSPLHPRPWTQFYTTQFAIILPGSSAGNM